MLAAVLTLSKASPTPLRPSSLETGIGGAHSSNIQESQTHSWGGGPTRADETLVSSFAASMRQKQFSTTRKRILQKEDIRFYRKSRELYHDSGILHLADKVSQTFHTQKNGVKNATMTQLRTTTTLCPVNIWAEIIIQLDSYSGTTSVTPVNTVWVERHKTTITSQMTTNSLRAGTLYFGEKRLGFSHKEVRTQSIRLGFAMELYLAKVYPETIMIMGRWASSAFLRYIHIQVSDISKGISTLMTNNHAFYTIPEIEVVYHTPGQPDTDPQRLRLNKRG